MDYYARRNYANDVIRYVVRTEDSTGAVMSGDQRLDHFIIYEDGKEIGRFNFGDKLSVEMFENSDVAIKIKSGIESRLEGGKNSLPFLLKHDLEWPARNARKLANSVRKQGM